MGQEGGPLGRS